MIGIGQPIVVRARGSWRCAVVDKITKVRFWARYVVPSTGRMESTALRLRDQGVWWFYCIADFEDAPARHFAHERLIP